jgi:hypothetical protein
VKLSENTSGLGRSYDRTVWAAQRRAMMNLWGTIVGHAAATGEFVVPEHASITVPRQPRPAAKKPAPIAKPAGTVDARAVAALLSKTTGRRVTAAQVVEMLKAEPESEPAPKPQVIKLNVKTITHRLPPYAQPEPAKPATKGKAKPAKSRTAPRLH